MAAKASERLDDELIHDEEGDPNGKRRRVQRACDVCRKKKIRCDGLQPEKGSCSNCASYGSECTFADAVKRRPPPRSYVLALEARMEKAEELISQLAPYLDMDKAIGAMPVLPSDKKEGEEESVTSLHSAAPSGELSLARECSSNGKEDGKGGANDEEDETEEDEDAAYLRISMQNVSLCEEATSALVTRVDKDGRSDGQEQFRHDWNSIAFNDVANGKELPNEGPGSDPPMQFLGRASDFHIIAMLEKVSQTSPKTMPIRFQPPPDPLHTSEFDDAEGGRQDYSKFGVQLPAYDLQQKLISTYFARSNRDLPILNEVVTRRMLSKPSWEWRDSSTLIIALGIFCVSSRQVNDDRLTLADGSFVGAHWHRLLREILVEDFTKKESALSYIQGTLLSIIYSAAVPKEAFIQSWVSLSISVRILEECGAHRKFTASRLGYTLVNEEMYKRLWWVTYVLDRKLSAELGRPMAIQDEDFDLDEILLVDDDVLVEASEQGVEARQPAGRICVYEGFLQMTRLSQVIGRTLRTIYAISKSKISRGFVGKKWDALVVADIDRSLNKWLEGVPSHLGYNPNEPDAETLLQSSSIFVTYYFTQMLIHRPFIQSEKINNSDLSFKSLAIVSNASRSSIHIVYNLLQRGLLHNSSTDLPIRVFGFGCILLFISWSARANHLHVSQSIMEDVRKSLTILQSLQDRLATARKMTAMMQIIIRRSEIPVLEPRQSSKRGHEDTEGQKQHQHQHHASDWSSATLPPGDPTVQQAESGPRQFGQFPTSYTNLPLSTTELQSAFGSNSQSPDSIPPTSASQSQFPDLLHQQSYSQDRAAASTGRPGPNRVDWAGQAQTGSWSQQAEAPVDPFLAPSQSDPFIHSEFIDSTMFDPSNRSLDAYLSGRMPQTAFEMFAGTPETSSGFANGPAGRTEAQRDGAGGGGGGGTSSGLEAQPTPSTSNLGDPLDALVNMQSLWSDSDWMRALENQT